MRKRNEENYRNAISRDGTFSPHINKTTSDRLTRYCKAMNLNRTRFVEHCVNAQLDQIEREAYGAMSKDQLIDIILKK